MYTNILNTFPTEFEHSLSSFNGSGALEPGDYAPTIDEFEQSFVNVGDVEKRSYIYDGWNRHRLELLEAGLDQSCKQLMNGSFTTNKHCPGDIDIAVEVPVEKSSDLVTIFNDNHQVVKLLQGPAMKDAFCCDAYPIYCLPPDDPHYIPITVESIKYWTKWFGHTRPPVFPKGRIWATVGGLR